MANRTEWFPKITKATVGTFRLGVAVGLGTLVWNEVGPKAAERSEDASRVTQKEFSTWVSHHDQMQGAIIAGLTDRLSDMHAQLARMEAKIDRLPSPPNRRVSTVTGKATNEND